MAKMRIYELAKQIDVSGKDIIKILQEKGLEVSTSANSISDEDIEYVKKKLLSPAPPANEKPKIIYTTKGVVRRRSDGERIRRPEGERRRRPDGERPVRPEGERRRRPGGERMRRPDGEQRKPESEQIKNTEASIQKTEKAKIPAAAVQKQPEPVHAAETKEEKAVSVKSDKPSEVQQKTVQVNAEEINHKKHHDKNERSVGEKRRFHDNNYSKNQDGGRIGRQDGGRSNKPGGDRQNRNDKFGGKTFNRDNRGRDNRNNNEWENNNNRNSDRRNDRRRNNDFDRTPAIDVIAQDKDRKSREDKIRQDKQERNRRNYDSGDRSGKKQGRRDKQQSKSVLQKPEQKKAEPKVEEIKVISVPEVLTIGDLAEKMKMQPSVIIKKLFMDGKIVTINTDIDFETAEEIALEYEIMCEKEVKVDVIEELLKEEEEDESSMTRRPPVICVMGHVDHGKTSLLDAIRKTNVISGEAGGITQHIGAYVVNINGKTITFLDTPGHEAFTSMRMRGAQATDIAVLVVAADDGVMPQTIEAINHAKAAGVEIIVAINKIDKPGANLDKVKKELAEHELLPEEWGGGTVCVPVSAHTGEGIEELLEMILLEADVLELKANADRLARGIVIEAQLDKGRGPVATVLVQKGTLKVGDPIAAGSNHGRVRAMIDDKGSKIQTAGPSTPVEILGLNGVPNAGEVFVSTETTNDARDFADTFIAHGREKLLEGTKSKLSLDDLYSQIQAGDVKELNIIIKADVQGSVEAVKQSLVKLSNDEVVVKVIHGGVGIINESDVILASASNAIIIGFNTTMDNQAKDVSANEKVDVRLYDVIYNAIEDIEAAMKGMLDPVYEEQIIAHVEVRQTFKASGVGTIAGAYVLDGTIKRGCSVRITRDGEQIYEGTLASLKRFKDDVKEVKSGFECGLVFDKFNDLAEGDMIEAYVMVETARN